MKTVKRSLGLITRLSILASALLLGQQALALGTDAGVTVSNQASVAYDVGLISQTAIESSPSGNSVPGSGAPTTFQVDRRVSFTLIETSGTPTTPVAPGDINVIASFTLINTGNAIMDFDLSVADLAAAVFGNADTTDLVNYRARAGNGQGAGGVPTLADLAWVDELAEEGIVEIYVFADAPVTVLNGEYANIRLTATAADHVLADPTPGVLDDILVEDPGVDDPTEIETVFGDAGNDGFEEADDSYEIITAAALEITKIATVISDPFGSGKAVPGAVIEYTITVDNTTGASAATNVVITDLIDGNVTYQTGVYDVGVTDSDISFDAGASFCIADLADANTDGCSLDGAGNLVVGSVLLPITVAAGASLTVQFQVLIPNL
ncbi:MAG: hypothetical protein ACE1ZA_10620 [Pseudomonadales bacterium]